MGAKDRCAIASRAESTNSAGAVQLTPSKFGASNASRPAGTWESAGREKRVTVPPVDHALTQTIRAVASVIYGAVEVVHDASRQPSDSTAGRGEPDASRPAADR